MSVQDTVQFPVLQEDPPSRRRWQWTTKRIVAVVAAAVLVIAGGGTAYGVDRHNEQVKEQQDKAAHLASAVASSTQSRSDALALLSKDVAAYQKALDDGGKSITDQVSDPATVTTLQDLIKNSQQLLSDAKDAGVDIKTGASPSDIDALTSRIGDVDGKVKAATSNVTAATKALTDSHAAWTDALAKASAAFDAAIKDLNSQIAASQKVLGTSNGKVSDDSKRTVLATSIGVAQQVTLTVKGSTPDEVTQQTQTITSTTSDLLAKTKAVSGSATTYEGTRTGDINAVVGVSDATKAAAAASGLSWAEYSRVYANQIAATECTGQYAVPKFNPDGSYAGCDRTEQQNLADFITSIKSARSALNLTTVDSHDGCAVAGVVNALGIQQLQTNKTMMSIALIQHPAALVGWQQVNNEGYTVNFVRVYDCQGVTQ